MKKLLLITLFVLPLYGCVTTTALMIGATAGGAIIYDKRSLKAMAQDRRISRHANAIIARDSELKGRSHISISVFNQVALLVGQTQTLALKQHASNIIKNIKNLRRTYNGITVAGSTTELQRVSDTWITSKVRTALLKRHGLRSNDIKVVTEAGVVYLMGNVGRDQADLSADAARHVSGVVKVVKVFEYT